MTPQPVITRDLSSGRVHIRTRYYEGGPLQVYEECNLQRNEAGTFEELEDVPEDTDPGMLCKHCFPPE